MSEVDEIRAAGWTQGSVLVANLQLDSGLDDGKRYLVVSHPCDVASLSLERDPTVELLRIADKDAVDGNLTFGKNPRRLHLISEGGILEVDFTGRVSVDRRILTRTKPQLTLPEDSRRILAAWLASRYARPAFADEFNRRLSLATRGIERILKTGGSRISAIYVATALSELGPEVSYQVHMAFTMRSADFADAALFAVVSENVDQIGDLIRPLEGIDLRAIEVFSEEKVSLDALRTYARWDYDSLSYKEGEEAVLPAQS